jgi:hypothetical protein
MARSRRRRPKTKTARTKTRKTKRSKTQSRKTQNPKTQSRKTRSRKTRSRQTKTRPAQTRKPRTTLERPVRITLPRPARAETLLLTLAKDLTGTPLEGAVRQLADAFTHSAELPREIYVAWIKSRREKTASLALSWAREQVRLSLEETIARTSKRPRLELTPDALAWLLLAACEAMAHEPPSAVADRVRTVLELSGHAAPGG